MEKMDCDLHSLIRANIIPPDVAVCACARACVRLFMRTRARLCMFVRARVYACMFVQARAHTRVRVSVRVCSGR